MPKSQVSTRHCERCGIDERDTEMMMLAMNGDRLVCSECDSDLDNEWTREERGRIHPLDTLNAYAQVVARFC